MSTDKTLRISSTSSDQTEWLAEKLGAKLRGGETIELVSDLGGGKTTFTRGLARGAGSVDKVASPTFTLSREYGTPEFTIVHLDLYRLGQAGVMADELAELVGDPAYVVVVEWGEIVQDVLPRDRLTVAMRFTGETERQLTISYPKGLSYLVS